MTGAATLSKTAYLEQILPDYEFYQPSADPATFRRKFALLKEKLRAA
jgi:hypothetical protein